MPNNTTCSYTTAPNKLGEQEEQTTAAEVSAEPITPATCEICCGHKMVRDGDILHCNFCGHDIIRKEKSE